MSYRDYLDRQGVPKGPWIIRERDSDRSAKRQDREDGPDPKGESAGRQASPKVVRIR